MIPAESAEAIGPVNLNEMLRDVLDLVDRSPARRRHHASTGSRRPCCRRCRERRTSCVQLFKALVDNAIEAMNTRGCRERELTVVSKARLGGVEVVIGDSGPGIEDAQQLKVFEPFHTTKRGGGHLGTGLSSAQQIAAEHGGFIEIEPPITRGCRVRVLLPLASRP
jgi:C4-dicarboxylate-specific signal transduction histidine kinase